ncbi:MAG TPA: short-chain dehydrogenase [Deltaproteobacteria bacterium]|nr:short-chain dehydrogenase [Deltaproteobacteria bacterium]
MNTLAGKRALITGGASGIGKALAQRLAAEDAELLLVDRNEELLGETAAGLVAGGKRCRTYVLDVTDTEGISALRDQVHREGGPIDLLVNNAGLVYGGSFLEVPLEQHLTTYRVNTLSVVAITHTFLPDLIAGRDGHVVNIASASGLIGLPFGATYASSKWAVLGFSESLALELEIAGHRHVHVTVVCPSYVATGLFEGVRPPLATKLLTAERVADLTVRAVRRNQPYVRTPWLVQLTPFMKAIAPFGLFYRGAALLGVNTSMVHWRGRTSGEG